MHALFAIDFIKLGTSCYSSEHLSSGSWQDAEVVCNGSGSHLWSINSHEEFYHIFTKTEPSLKDYLLDDKDIHESSKIEVIFDPRLSPHFFIGLYHTDPWKSHTIKVGSTTIQNMYIH